MAKSKRKTRNNTPANQQQQKTNNNKTATVSAQQIEYSGPIPPASELQKYNAVIPDAAERILVMAEKNQQHSIDIDHKALDAARREARRGQVFAFLITLSAFATSIAALVMGHPSVASVIGGATVVSLAVAFIKGRTED